MEQVMIKSNTLAMSEDIRALSHAFLLAKREFLATGFGGTNSHQKYSYAKLEDIYNAVEGALWSNNIIIWHFSQPEEGKEYLHTRLIHTLTGQYVEDRRLLESEKAGNQAKGAANTYMRKYAVLSLCAIATQDDDGEDENRYIERRAQEPCISQEQLKMLQEEIKACANGKVIYSNVLKFNTIQDLAQLKVSKFEAVIAYIRKNKE